MLLTEPKPAKKRKPSRNKEAKLQASIIIDFSQKRPDERGRLIGYFANTSSKQDGGMKTSLGLVKNVSDLLYFTKDSYIWGIELKAEGEYHNVEHLKGQAMWLKSVAKVGYFCDSLDMFWKIIDGGAGIEPDAVLRYLEGVKTDSIKWDSNIFNVI